jgi:hypothetical protein
MLCSQLLRTGHLLCSGGVLPCPDRMLPRALLCLPRWRVRLRPQLQLSSRQLLLPAAERVLCSEWLLP